MDVLESAQRLVDGGMPWVSQYGLWVVGITAFLQLIPGVMFVVPGLAINVAAGYYAAEGAFSFGEALGAAWLGAFLGVQAVYLAGRRIGALKRRSRWQVRARVARALERDPLWLPLYYVYSSPVRSALPYVAGVLRYPWRRFSLLNVLAIVPWMALQLVYGIFAHLAIEGDRPVLYTVLLVLMLALSVAATLLLAHRLGIHPGGGVAAEE